jgi:hypothetical protein
VFDLYIASPAAQVINFGVVLQDGIQVLTYHLSSIYCACSRWVNRQLPALQLAPSATGYCCMCAIQYLRTTYYAAMQAAVQPARSQDYVLADFHVVHLWQHRPSGGTLLARHAEALHIPLYACRTLSDPAPARYADKAAHAGSFMRSSEPWEVVQLEQPGMKQLQYRMLRPAGAFPGSMWYV